MGNMWKRALLVGVFGLTATAFSFGSDINRDRRDIARDQRELRHDYNRLQRDEYRDNWRAVQRDRAEIYRDRADLRHDYADVARDRYYQDGGWRDRFGVWHRY